ncbi:response regulator [Aureispira anguillae]|uniref:Response regulator n=1 Tax=Aureispira anguillae TaxID=2864201 RepID=A0A915YM91_9BACT|nr:response regulator [Aureispira anguillae]BDS15713.1 response regulator [Aureispira anguillae]
MNKKYKILLLEDDPYVSSNLEEELEELNFEVLSVFNKQDAFIKLNAIKFDLAILDIRIGNDYEAGIEVASYIKDHIQIPFIYLTSNNDGRIKEAAFVAEPNSYLPKPYDIRVLLPIIELAFFNYSKQGNFRAFPKPLTDSIFIKKNKLIPIENEKFKLVEDKGNFGKSKIMQGDIVWIRSSKNRVFLKTINQSINRFGHVPVEEQDCYCLSTTLKKFESFVNPWFIKRASNAALINLNYVENIIDQAQIIMSDKSIIRVTNKKLLDYFNITKAK